MLKSFEFINILKSCFEDFKNKKIISKFFIKLSVNQQIKVYIASDEINSIEGLEKLITKHFSSSDSLIKSFKNNSIFYELFTNLESDDEYSYYFNNKEVDLGLRRSLDALLEPTSQLDNKKPNLITFYSYKGGVGRTTALALTATHLSRQGKNVFVLDCDFEAPGLINFFNTAQSDTQKSGLVEYLNDKIFDSSTNMDEYIYNVEKVYSGTGSINLMPAGNVLGEPEDLSCFLEGLSRIDLQGSNLINTFSTLISDIQLTYAPDVILVDSRTGFNNIFGSLVKLSKLVVTFAGDDTQNLPGTEYVNQLLKDSDVNSCFVLSILSASFSRRYNNFQQYIQNIAGRDADTFYFDRQNILELIGTPQADIDDLNDFINGENGSPQYQNFFNYVEEVISANMPHIVEEQTGDEEQNTVLKETNININKPDISETPNNTGINNIHLQDRILAETEKHLPDLYADNIDFTTDHVNKYFYIRPCMEDLFIPEKVILLGDKGTGKTAFYKALQIKDFFNLLIEKSQRKHLNYKVSNITNHEIDTFEVVGLDDTYIKNELFIKKFWIFYIWNAISSRSDTSTSYEQLNVDLSKTGAISKIIEIVDDSSQFDLIENELSVFNDKLKSKDERLIITFDQLDNIVKPYLWDNIISPLIKLCMKFPWSNIYPKLFLRRDLYERLGNLTNKNSFKPKSIDLEWSKNEIYSYFLKIVFTFCNADFYKYLDDNLSSSLVEEIRRKLNKKALRNQLPLDTHLIQPVINLFFGTSRPKKNGKISSAYEDLYRNIQSADRTVNLRPFLDLLKYAIIEQESQDSEKQFRKNSIIGLAYCTSREVRKMAVVTYLSDLWGEQGNELVKYFCQDLSNNRVNPKYKRGKLDEKLFESLLQEIRENNVDVPVVANSTINDFKQILIANKIITPYMVGSKTRYGYAYLYTNFLGM